MGAHGVRGGGEAQEAPPAQNVDVDTSVLLCLSIQFHDRETEAHCVTMWPSWVESRLDPVVPMCGDGLGVRKESLLWVERPLAAPEVLGKIRAQPWFTPPLRTRSSGLQAP